MIVMLSCEYYGVQVKHVLEQGASDVIAGRSVMIKIARRQSEYSVLSHQIDDELLSGQDKERSVPAGFG